MATSVSLTIPPTASSLLNPTPTGTSIDFPLTNSNSGGGESRNVSYFFGFLIAVIAFLVFFIGCSIGTRRRLLRRRRLDAEAGAASSSDRTFGRVASRPSPPKEPLLWETGFEKGGSRWESIMVSILYSMIDRTSLFLLQPLTFAPALEGEDDDPPSYIPLSMPMPIWLRPRERTPPNSMLRWWMPSLPRI